MKYLDRLKRAVLAAACAGLALAGLLALPAIADDSLRCQHLRIAVALTPGAPADQTISAILCRPSRRGGTLQILLHGATYSHIYWDFPYQPGRYSYVGAMSCAGYATLNLDRLGIGASSHPPADALTGTSEAYVTHQLVQLALSGGLDGEAFERVVLVGHSLGAFIAVSEAGTYGDVSGLVLSGNIHNDGDPATWDSFLSALVPAQQVSPRFANLPDGYFTTAPRNRNFFYYLPGAEPAVIAIDDATRETLTFSEADGDDMSAAIHVPVFASVGKFDGFNGCVSSCGPGGPPPPPDGLAAEAAYFPNAPSFDVYVQPRAGHDQNLHVTAPDFYAAVRSWLASHGFGPKTK
jgi:pimeloyl-ACP methyl ester carboxylesterase